jgi:excisionase family DNA binding protein
MNTQPPASSEDPGRRSFTEMEKTNMDLLTIEEVAELTRLPVATLRWYRAMGKGGPKSGKLGRRVVYRRADVEAWIAAAFDATGS